MIGKIKAPRTAAFGFLAIALTALALQPRAIESQALALGGSVDGSVPALGHYKQLRDDTYLVVLKPGAKVMESLTQFQAQTGLKAGALTGVGVVRNTTLGFYKFNADGTPAGTHTDDTVRGAREITSLTCNFMTRIIDDQGERPAPPHCHIALAGMEDPVADAGKGWPVVGGHLIEAEVGVTAEFIVTAYPVDVTKRPGGALGGFLIDAETEQGGTPLAL